MMEACCAHLKVVYKRIERTCVVTLIKDHPIETTVCSDHWECADCGQPFSPVDRGRNATPPDTAVNLGIGTPIEPGDIAPQPRNAPPLGSQPTGLLSVNEPFTY